MNLKYLLLFMCFIQILNYCYGDDNLSLSNKGFLSIPKCRYNVDTLGFLLFTRENRHGVSLTLKNLTSNNAFKESQLTCPVVFLIHGFVSSENDQHFLDMAQALLNKDHLCVISINWKEAACTNEPTLLQYTAYPKAVANTRLVGKYVADFTKILVEEYKVSMKDIRLIGHSLGAQVSGFAGKEVQKLKLGKYFEIIGLDPAGPLFRKNSCSQRICETDADYVQIIHTSNILGTAKALGTVDFYMNKGRSQPGCDLYNASCSHAKAVGYLTECIKRECCLIGIPWDKSTQPLSTCTKNTCVCVGLNAKKYPATGSFYVPVEVNPPYCNNNGDIL